MQRAQPHESAASDAPRRLPILSFYVIQQRNLLELPDGHDPNSFFVNGGGAAQQFQTLLERAHS
jgi:hypothetical protein